MEWSGVSLVGTYRDSVGVKGVPIQYCHMRPRKKIKQFRGTQAIQIPLGRGTLLLPNRACIIDSVQLMFQTSGFELISVTMFADMIRFRLSRGGSPPAPRTPQS